MSIQVFKEKCYKFNIIAGKQSVKSKQDIKNQIALIREEVQELVDDFGSNNPVKTLDGVIDILVTTLGLAQQLESLGFDVDKAMLETADNNLTKYTPNAVEAALTQDYYERKGIVTEVMYDTTNEVWVIKNAKTSKVLKPTNFQSNDLVSCVPDLFIEKGFDAL
jgi:hypothetical protein